MCLCGSNGSFPAAGGEGLGKNSVAKVIAPFPLSKIAHWSILLRRNDICFGIADPAARIRFYLHKEFRAAEIRFSLHEESRAAEIRFSLHKEFRALFEIFE